MFFFLFLTVFSAPQTLPSLVNTLEFENELVRYLQFVFAVKKDAHVFTLAYRPESSSAPERAHRTMYMACTFITKTTNWAEYLLVLVLYLLLSLLIFQVIVGCTAYIEALEETLISKK